MSSEFFIDFTTFRTPKALSNALGTTEDVLMRLASDSAADFYRRHAIPKRSTHRKGEVREVFEPATEELRHLHRVLNRRLAAFASHKDHSFPLSCCYGFVRHRSALDNARQHKGSPLLLRADIENFFPSIPRARVIGELASLGIDQELATLLGRTLSFTGFLVP